MTQCYVFTWWIANLLVYFLLIFHVITSYQCRRIQQATALFRLIFDLFLLLAKNLHSRNVEHHHHQSTIVSNSIDNSSMRVRVHKKSLSHVIDDDEVDPRLLFLSVVVGKRKFHQIKVSNVTQARRRRRKMDLIFRYESRIYRHISTFFYYLGWINKLL